MRVIRDRVMNADPGAVATAAMTVLDTLQDRDVNEQIQATACLFVLFTRRYNLPAAEILTAAGRLMEDADSIRPEFRAAHRYMAQEWAD